VSSSERGEPRLIAPYAKRRLAFNGVTVLAAVLLLVNLPLFIASDVVGEVEFRLPTTVTEGEVVSLESPLPALLVHAAGLLPRQQLTLGRTHLGRP